MTRILQVVASLHVGGLETVAMNCMRYADKEKYHFDFLVVGDDQGEYEKEAAENGCKIIHIPAPRNKYIQYYRNLCNVMKKNGPYDVVHSHVFFNSGIVLMAAKQCGVPMRIAHAHSVKRKNDAGFHKTVFQSIMRHLLIRNATRFCACSQQAGDYVFSQRAFREKGMVLPNTIDANAFAYSETDRSRIRNELNIARNAVVVGQVGHLTPAKNQQFLLEMFAEYRKAYPGAVLLLVGDGELRMQLQHKIKELGLEDSVRLTGTRSDVEALLSAMDVYVCTSTNEGFGITLLEAAANGLRIVVENNVLVDELKSVVSYRSVEGFDAKKWADAVLDVVTLGRYSNVMIEDSAYSAKGFHEKVNQLYSLRGSEV